MKNLLLILIILISSNSAWALAPRAFTSQDTQGDVLDGEDKGKITKDGIGKRGEFDLDRAIRFISDRFAAEPSRSSLPSQDEIAAELGVSQMTVSHRWETILAELQRLKDPRIESAILLWRQKEASEGKFNLEQAVSFIEGLFQAEPSRLSLPSQEEIATGLGVKQQTVSEHWETILAELQRLKDPRIESAILLWRQREASEGKFNLEQAISFIEGLFKAEPSRLSLPSQEEIATELGVNEMTVSRHWEEILAELQRLKDPRIESAILLWRQREASEGKFDLEAAVSFIKGLFKAEPSRSILPSQRMIAAALGVDDATVSYHWEAILAELQRLDDPRIESAISLWRQQHLKERGAPRSKFNLEQAVSFIKGLFKAEPSRLRLPSQRMIATALGVNQMTISHHWEEILAELQRLKDPRIESAILLWRQREASKGKFSLEETVSSIEDLFKAESSRPSRLSQRMIAARLGVSYETISYYWETILAELERLQDQRISDAISRWKERYRGATLTLAQLGLTRQWDESLERFVVGRPVFRAPDEDVVKQERLELVYKAIGSLPKQDQEICRRILDILTEQEAESLDVAELAEATGFSQEEIAGVFLRLRNTPELQRLAEAWGIGGAKERLEPQVFLDTSI